MIQDMKNSGQTFSSSVKKCFRNFGLEEGLLVWKWSGNRRVDGPSSDGLMKQVIKKFQEKAHFGSMEVYAEAAHYVYWSSTLENIQREIACCKAYLANELERRRKAGRLVPHNIPKRCWEHITADFITEFPTTIR